MGGYIPPEWPGHYEPPCIPRGYSIRNEFRIADAMRVAIDNLFQRARLSAPPDLQVAMRKTFLTFVEHWVRNSCQSGNGRNDRKGITLSVE